MIGDGLRPFVEMQRRNLRTAFADPRQGLFMAAVLLVQDYVFVLLWAVFFRHVGSVGGWDLQDVATLFGLAFCGMGLTGLMAGGNAAGNLTQPRHPLVAAFCCS